MREFIREIGADLQERMENSEAISIFVKNRSKFEGWLKVELAEALMKNNCKEILPENDGTDMTFKHDNKNFAIELKTVNTNYRFANVENKGRPITSNVSGVVWDIAKLKKLPYDKRVMIFVVFPLDINRNRNWKDMHLPKVTKMLKKEPLSFPLNFRSQRPGMLYICSF